MKSSVLRQASLPSQDNPTSPEQEIQQPNIGVEAKAPNPPLQKATQENGSTRRHHPAANDANSERSTLSLISIQQVISQTGVGRTTIYALIKTNEFPRPVKVCGASRWVREEISAWIGALMLKRP